MVLKVACDTFDTSSTSSPPFSAFSLFSSSQFLVVSPTIGNFPNLNSFCRSFSLQYSLLRKPIANYLASFNSQNSYLSYPLYLKLKFTHPPLFFCSIFIIDLTFNIYFLIYYFFVYYLSLSIHINVWNILDSQQTFFKTLFLKWWKYTMIVTFLYVL